MSQSFLSIQIYINPEPENTLFHRRIQQGAVLAETLFKAIKLNNDSTKSDAGDIDNLCELGIAIAYSVFIEAEKQINREGQNDKSGI